jgi:hypothetical protein
MESILVRKYADLFGYKSVGFQARMLVRRGASLIHTASGQNTLSGQNASATQQPRHFSTASMSAIDNSPRSKEDKICQELMSQSEMVRGTRQRNSEVAGAATTQRRSAASLAVIRFVGGFHCDSQPAVPQAAK